jgi:molybdopterin synthase catalytic subunit
MQTEIIFTHAPIVVPPLSMPTREIGACVEFQGIVRELEEGRPLTGLEYEAHESMARKELGRLFDQLQTGHPIASILFVHRLGWVPVGEASMFLRVLAAHRGEALAFCGKAIDRLKQDVPIWKCAAVAPPASQ